MIESIRGTLKVCRRRGEFLGCFSLPRCANEAKRFYFETIALALTRIVRRWLDGVCLRLEREDTREDFDGDFAGLFRKRRTRVVGEIARGESFVALPRPAIGKAGETEEECVE